MPLMKKYLNFFKSLLAAFFLTAFILAPAGFALSEGETPPSSTTLGGLNATADAGYGQGYTSTQSSFDIYKQAGLYVGIILSLIAIVFLGIMLYGGFIWMMARGNAEEAKKALTLINDAMIGLIIILGAYVITQYIGTIFVGK